MPNEPFENKKVMRTDAVGAFFVHFIIFVEETAAPVGKPWEIDKPIKVETNVITFQGNS